jgi:hypothetical protein
MEGTNHVCNACGATTKPLMKLSVGKDFFGRPYDRLSPSSDQNPKWYCETCSMQKNLQRDFRDIRTEFEKHAAGQASAFNRADELQRAFMRVREIAAILESIQGRSPFLDAAEVRALMGNLQIQPQSAPVSP